MDVHDEHRYALFDDALVDAQNLSTAVAQHIRQAAKDQLICPVCREPLIAKFGAVVTWHFAHRADSEYRWHESESDPHRLGKRRLREYAQMVWPHAEVREEWRLPAIKQIADVMAWIPTRRPVALEIQYADLSAASWRARHNGYRSIGIDDCWFLGHTRLRRKGKMVTLDTLASAIIGARQPLLYLQPRSQLVTWVRVAPGVLFRASQERIGKVQAEIVKAPLKTLRFDGGTPYFMPD